MNGGNPIVKFREAWARQFVADMTRVIWPVGRACAIGLLALALSGTSVANQAEEGCPCLPEPEAEQSIVIKSEQGSTAEDDSKQNSESTYPEMAVASDQTGTSDRTSDQDKAVLQPIAVVSDYESDLAVPDPKPEPKPKPVSPR